MTWQGREGMNESDAILTRLTYTNNAAAAHADAAIADLIERIEAVLERLSGDDPAIIFGRGVDIMIVIVQPVLGQFTRLPFIQHAHSRGVPMPNAWTHLITCKSFGMSRSLRLRHVAPVEKRWDPPAFACSALASTASTSISFSASIGVSARAD